MLSSLGGYLAECGIISSVFFFKFKVILHFLLLLLYCAVLLNAKLYALSDDVACC